ncbi:MAG: hypothetical protein J1F02_05805 [Lachnospiraceae bacterium]|nr:hypothetical protein [Lachnospiraceae bacterium]
MKIRRIAHRGFSSEAPENSRAAFAMAVEGDFYGVECDVWRCRDGTYVVSHDGQLKRMCGVERWIPNMLWEEVCHYPFIQGQKISCHPMQYPIRLAEYLSILRRSDTMCPVIELKMDYTTVELREIVDLVEKYDLLERCCFISLHPMVLLRLKQEFHFPSERLQYVYGAIALNRDIPVDEELMRWLAANRINLDARYTLVSAESVRWLHNEGLEVNVWTVNDREQTRRMVQEIQVDMVTTEFYHEI